MRKVIIIIVLMLFLVPTAFASTGKMIQLNNSNSTVIDIGAVQQMDLIGDTIVCIKFGYSSRWQSMNYRTKEAARNDYQRIFKEVKNHRVNECLRYGGGKACHSI